MPQKNPGGVYPIGRAVVEFTKHIPADRIAEGSFHRVVQVLILHRRCPIQGTWCLFGEKKSAFLRLAHVNQYQICKFADGTNFITKNRKLRSGNAVQGPSATAIHTYSYSVSHFSKAKAFLPNAAVTCSIRSRTPPPALSIGTTLPNAIPGCASSYL